MLIRAELVAEVVAEASQKMSDANFSAVLVGEFVQCQAAAARYISSHENELDGATGVVNTVFHAALLSRCFYRAQNRDVPTMRFEDLDHVAGSDAESRLKDKQPALLEYIEANVENPTMRKVLVLLALAMDWVS